MAVLARLQERLQSLQEEYFLTYRYLGRAGAGAGYTASCWAAAGGRAGPALRRQRDGGGLPGNCPVLGSSVQGRLGAPAEGPVESCEDDLGAAASLLRRKVEGAGPVLPRKEMSERAPHSCLPSV